jgi:hypothetical protein
VETIGDFFDGLCRKLSAQKEQESKWSGLPDLISSD